MALPISQWLCYLLHDANGNDRRIFPSAKRTASTSSTLEVFRLNESFTTRAIRGQNRFRWPAIGRANREDCTYRCYGDFVHRWLRPSIFTDHFYHYGRRDGAPGPACDSAVANV